MPTQTAIHHTHGDRWPDGFVERRLAREAFKERRLVESGDPIRRIAQAALKFSGFRAAGRRNALDLRLEHNKIALPGLPAALEGFRILHLSDLHIPETGDDDLMYNIAQLSADTPHELAVLTGDYRDRSFGPFEMAIGAMHQLRPALAETAVAILGNHDSISSVAPMESMGYHFLVNETMRIERAGAAFDLLGIDDPAYYRQHDLHACVAGCSTPHRILLSHSPDPYNDAKTLGIDAVLCGHTHGGQMCLPGGFAIRRSSAVPRNLLSGAWRSGAMQGYTSRGAGTSIIDARSFCPPELTLHTLIAAPQLV